MEPEKKERTCEGCVWRSECRSEPPCDNYTPESAEEADEIAVEEYNAQVIARYEYYIRQIDQERATKED